MQIQQHCYSTPGINVYSKSCNFVYPRNRQLNRMRFILSRRLMALFHGKRCGSEDALSVPLAESSALTAASCTQLPAVHCSYSRFPPHQPPTGPGFLRFGGRLSAAVDMNIKLAAFSS